VQITLWTSRRYKPFHTTTTPLLFPGQLWRKGKKLSKKSTTIVQGSLELNGSQQDQRGPIESELNEYGQGVVFLPQSLADTGVLPLISAPFWTSSLGKWLATHGFLQHWLFRSQSLVQTEACTQMGSRNCSGIGDSSSGSPEGLRCSPLLCGRKLFF